jgi:hypothetical protein
MIEQGMLGRAGMEFRIRHRSASDMQSVADLWSLVRAEWSERQLPLAMKGWPGWYEVMWRLSDPTSGTLLVI